MFWKFSGYALTAAIIGYCIYFDKKRRMDPNYKQKVRERRLNQKRSFAFKSIEDFPKLNDRVAVNKFYEEHLQLGLGLYTRGEIEKAVDHMAKAAIVCGQTEYILQTLHASLEPEIFSLLLRKVQFYRDLIVQVHVLHQGSKSSL